MKNVLIAVFSGTGNTLRTADYFKKSFENHGYSAEILNINRNTPAPDTKKYSIIGFGYPIHAFNTPEIFNAFVKKLPQEENKKCFVFKTSGEPFKINNSSSAKLFSLLKKKGYIPSNEIHLLMPYNIMFRYPDGIAAQMDYYSRKMAEKEVGNIIEGKKTHIKHGIFSRMASVIFRIEQPSAKFNGRFYKADTAKCINCMLCAEHCPENNIKYENGRLIFGRNCSLCMRCSMNCPADAISIGLLKRWKVNPPYEFEKYAEEKIPFGINSASKGYFGKFRKFFKQADIFIGEDKNKNL